MLFADDLALFSHSPAGLQAQLNILQEFCRSRGLKVNVAKTKIVVFEHRKSPCPSFHFEGEEIARVDEFKYLGIIFHCTRGLSCAIEQLVISARKALFAMYATCRKLHIYEPTLRCKLFDALVRPVLSYSCELWALAGGEVAMKQLEKVHLTFLKKLLGVPDQTTTKMVYAECGRMPLKHFWWKQCMKYLHRMHELEDTRLCKVAFLADYRNHTAWRKGLEKRCQKLDIAPPTPGQEFDIHAAIDASTTHYTQWIMQPDPDSRKQLTYFSFKTEFRFEPYISEAENVHLRRIVASFRTGCHDLHVESGRHRKVDYEQRVCPSCKDVVEDEEHAIFVCPEYDQLRRKFADLFVDVTSLRSFLTQKAVHRIALFLTECRAIRMLRGKNTGHAREDCCSQSTSQV